MTDYSLKFDGYKLSLKRKPGCRAAHPGYLLTQRIGVNDEGLVTMKPTFTLSISSRRLTRKKM